MHSIAIPHPRGAFAITLWPGLCVGTDVAVGLEQFLRHGGSGGGCTGLG